MIAHVAAAAEQRGRVVLQLCSEHPNRIALEAALRVAKAFESEVESLFIEDRGLLDCACYPFVREVSLSGRHSHPLSAEAVERQMRWMAAAIGRELSELARLVDVPLRHTVVRDEPVAALARACSERGPWNVVALGHTLGREAGDCVQRMFEAVTGTTGLILAGPAARRMTGPVVVVVEELSDLEPMLRAAERLSPPRDGERKDGQRPADAREPQGVTLLLVGDSEDKSAWMEGQARLVLGETAEAVITHAVVTEGGEAVLAEVLRRLRGGFVVGRFGGILAPPGDQMRHLVASLECPLFLMR